MILLRQKLYTRQDKKVIHELWANTKGFRKLPKNWEKLTARDYFRLNKFSNGFGRAWTKGDASQIDWQDFKTMMEHMGLSETAKGGKHLIEKYTNPELLERYRSIKAHRAGLGKEYEEYKKLEKDMVSLYKKRNRLYEKRHNITGDDRKEVEKRLKLGKKIDQLNDRWYNGDYSKKFVRYNDLGFKLNQIDSDKIDLALKKANELPSLANLDKHTPGKGFENRQLRLAIREYPEINKQLQESNNEKELYERLKTRLSHRTIAEDPSKYSTWGIDTSCADFDSNGGRRKYINMHRDHFRNPAVLAHEEGHFRTLKRLGGKRKRSYISLNNIQKGGDEVYSKGLGEVVSVNPLSSLVNEYSASREGLNLLRKAGASQEEFQKAKEGLTSAGQSYYRSTLARLRGDINNKLTYPTLL